MANYVPPSVLAHIDTDTIHKRMLSVLPSNIDQQEGGGAWDLTRPAASEASLMYNAINVAIQVMFPQYSYDQFTDYHAMTVGLERRPENAASGTVEVTGVAGTTVSIGFLFATPSIDGEPNLEFEVTETTVLGNGTTSIPIECTTAGLVGNVDAGSVTLMVEPLQGIETITNAAALTGGTDEEDDETLIARIFQRDSTGDQSYVGSDADYVRWALEVSGVGDVIVVPEWMGAGTGTVRLIIIDSNGEPANQSILNAVYDHIMSDSDRLLRIGPMDLQLTVSAPDSVTITIAATVTLDEDTSITDVRVALSNALKTYYTEAAKEQVVRYTRISRILSEIDGVVDFTGLTANGGTSNIALDADEYPVSGSFNGVVSE